MTPDAYRADDERTQAMMAGTAWVAHCHSWYKAASGRVTNNWPTWTVRYWYDTLRLRPEELGVMDGPLSKPADSGVPGLGTRSVEAATRPAAPASR